MAAYAGPSREWVIAELRQGKPKLPITLGRGQPGAVIDRRDGSYVLLPLEMDQEAARAAGEAALARGENWMHEHTWQFLREGEPLIREDDKATFVAALEAIRWRW